MLKYMMSTFTRVYNRTCKTMPIFDGTQICDFGLAKWRQYSTTKTDSRSQRGTVTHIPPENWEDINTPRTVKFDVYSFGIMLWELLTEKIPFVGADNHQGSFKSCVLCT